MPELPTASPPADEKRPILCFGGSFNPPHLGHLICARAVAETAGFRRVRLIVSARPPHKPHDPAVIDPAHRLAMTRLAVAGDPLFEVDARETARAGPSYTIDTARQLLQEPDFAPGPIHWLIGADLLPGLMTWREPERLLAGDVVKLVVMARPGHAIDWPALPEPVRVLRQQVVEAPAIDISATDIRRRVREGREIRYLVPEGVRGYILARDLYREPAGV